MKRISLILLFTLLAAMLLISGGAAAQVDGGPAAGKIVVANRAVGTISVIDTETDQVIMTEPLPGPNPIDAHQQPGCFPPANRLPRILPFQ